MNNLSKLLFLFTLATICMTSCSKTDDNNNDWAAEKRRLDSLNQVRIDGLLEEQAPILKDFVAEKFPGDEAWTLDDSTGIWFKIHDPGVANSYTYRLVAGSMGGLALANPTVEVKYQGKLLTGEVFDETSADDPKKETYSSPIGYLIPAWNYAFYPKTINQNTVDYEIGGLTENGLQKGAIIELVTPSPWAYDNKEVKVMEKLRFWPIHHCIFI